VGGRLGAPIEGNHHMRAARAPSVKPKVVRPSDVERQLVVRARIAADPDALARSGKVLLEGAAPRRQPSSKRERLRLLKQRLQARALHFFHLPVSVVCLRLELREPNRSALDSPEQPPVLMEVPLGLLAGRTRAIQLNLDLGGTFGGVFGESCCRL